MAQYDIGALKNIGINATRFRIRIPLYMQRKEDAIQDFSKQDLASLILQIEDEWIFRR